MLRKKRRGQGRKPASSTQSKTSTKSRRSNSSLSRWLRHNNSMTTASVDDERGATETTGSNKSDHRDEIIQIEPDGIVSNSMDSDSEPVLSKSAKQRKFLAKLKEISGRHVENLPEERRADGGASWRMAAPSPLTTPDAVAAPDENATRSWTVPISPPVILSKTSKEVSKRSNSTDKSSSMQAVASSVQAVVSKVSSGCVSFQNMCTSREQVLFGESNGMVVGMSELMDQQKTKVRQTYIDRMPKELLREVSPPKGAGDGSPPMPASISFVKRDSSSLRRSPVAVKDATPEALATAADSQSISPGLAEDKYKVERDTSLLSSIMIVTDYGPGDDDDSMTSSIPTRHSHHLYSPP